MNTTTNAEYFSTFTSDPWWPVVVVKVLMVFVLLVLIVLLTIWAERRVVGRMQMRIGPNRGGPFDLPEAEGELVGGFHTEYSTLKFAVFFLAEYINMVTVSALATTLFLGGWRAPWPISLWAGANEGWWPVLWFLGKIMAFIFVFIWLRGTLPRLRYDQFMKFGWKVLIPVSLLWIVVVGFARAMRNEYNWDLRQTVLVIAIPILIVLVIMFVIETVRVRRADALAEQEEAAKGEFDPMAGGFPVPPMPGQAYAPTRRTRATVGATVLEAAPEDSVSTEAEEGSDG